MTVCPKCDKCLITKHSASQVMCDGCYFKKVNAKDKNKKASNVQNY